MEEFNVVGAIIGGLIGWIAAAIFSKGPKTPIQAFSGDYEGGGPGCVVFLLLLIIGAALGGFLAPAIIK
jgi:uncharacterized membrane protein YeaQ/YmgE (transglycosylase-associated protein family)